MLRTLQPRARGTHGRPVRIAGLAAPAIAILLLGGCTLTEPDTTVTQAPPATSQSTAASATGKDGAGQPSSNKTDETTDQNSGQEDTISPLEAAELALDAHPGTQVFSIELERVRGVTAWEVEVGSDAGKWEVSVDVVNGQIVEDKVEHSRHLAEDLALLRQAKVGYEDALNTMMGAVPGGKLLELEIDDHRGGAVWEGEIMAPNHQQHELVVDAVTGKIIEHEIDD